MSDLPTQPTPASEVLTLDQWAEETSRTDRRVELLNGFVTVQRSQRRFHATRTAWSADYAAFAARPV